MNATCEWPLAPTNNEQRSLVADVKIAEELAMRYADVNFHSKASHGRLRSSCEAELFAVVAQKHRVAPAAIEDARRQLDANVFDAPVHLPLLAFYFVAASFLARKVARRFATEEIVPAVLATVFLSFGLAVIFQVLGHIWNGTVEMVRLGDTHMSYRAERLGFRSYSADVFVLSVVLFWCAVLARYRTARPNISECDIPAPSHRS
jgi:hypothetical protein